MYTTSGEEEIVVMNFYHLVDLPNEEAELADHRAWLDGQDVRGRIYISSQGINAQLSAPKTVALAYAAWIKGRPHFGNLTYATFASPGHAFPKLYVRNKALVSLLRERQDLNVTDPEARAEKLDPARWKAMLAQATDPDAPAGTKPVVLDVRNGYEWDIGHFAGASRPSEYNFVDTPTGAQVHEGLVDADPETTPVMMYCTGGIRCDIYSAEMRRQGFKNLYTLEGGIQKYLEEEGADHWKGSLYVFDSRMAVPPHLDSTREDGELTAVAPCAICGGKAEAPHLNCANVDCNILFLACKECKPKYHGCCCAACVDAPRLLRPLKPEGYYGKMHQIISDAETDTEEDGEVLRLVTKKRSAKRLA